MMLKSFLSFSFLSFIIIPCSASKVIAREDHNSADLVKASMNQILSIIEVPKYLSDTVLPPPVFKIDTILRIEQSGCYGKCEVYELNILNDGTVIWNGLQHTRLKGLNVASMERVEMNELMALASTNSILNGPETYPDKNAYIADFPNKKITIKSAIKVKNILINNSPSSDLKKLISKIEFVVDHLEWKNISN